MSTATEIMLLAEAANQRIRSAVSASISRHDAEQVHNIRSAFEPIIRTITGRLVDLHLLSRMILVLDKSGDLVEARYELPAELQTVYDLYQAELRRVTEQRDEQIAKVMRR